MRFPSAVDPMTEDPRDREDREAELRRFKDERAFCELCQFNPYIAANAVAFAYASFPVSEPDRDEYGRRIMSGASAFAADYGWPAVFRILAAAIHAYDDAQARR
jgi:hypothetical protein